MNDLELKDTDLNVHFFNQIGIYLDSFEIDVDHGEFNKQLKYYIGNYSEFESLLSLVNKDLTEAAKWDLLSRNSKLNLIGQLAVVILE